MTASYLSPPKYAEGLGVDPAKVLAWIKSGELRAINVATTGTRVERIVRPLDADKKKTANDASDATGSIDQQLEDLF